MLSPRVISDGIVKVSSTHVPFRQRRFGVKKDPPRTDVLAESGDRPILASESSSEGEPRIAGQPGAQCRKGSVLIAHPSRWWRRLERSAAESNTLSRFDPAGKSQVGDLFGPVEIRTLSKQPTLPVLQPQSPLPLHLPGVALILNLCKGFKSVTAGAELDHRPQNDKIPRRVRLEMGRDLACPASP